ncbi:hypothetical protein BC829DRAFT_393959 [Chytridium lagenaria]|nr:hypothetical protein BC829DRAFT_393959 [Chytridium lagenaria]
MADITDRLAHISFTDTPPSVTSKLSDVPAETTEVRPSLEMLRRRRGGVCITTPNRKTVVTMGQIKQFYEQEAV